MQFPIPNYFIWTGDSQLSSLGSFSIRWNAILLVMGFLICRQILFYIYSKEMKPLNEVARLSVYLVLAGLLGARLGHELFYELKAAGANFPSILLPFEFKPDFHVLDRDEFSVQGATLGMLLFLWVYGRNSKHQNYLQLFDRLSIVAALSGVFILMGSFLSSEISGKPTHSSFGGVFIKPVLNGLSKLPCCIMRSPEGRNPLESVTATKDTASADGASNQKSVILYLFFRPGASEQLVNEFLIGDVKTYLYDMNQVVYEPGTEPLRYRIFLERDGKYVGRIQTKAISRYPVQLFEAIACAVLFILLFWLWARHKVNTPPGKLFACFMILFWSLHFAFGFLKENQGTVEAGLDILFVLAGITTLVLSRRKNRVVKY